MMKNAIPFVLLFGVLGCSATQRDTPHRASDSDAAGTELRQLKEELGRLDNRLGHLESEVSAASAENELTSLTIDSVGWADASTAQVFGSKNALVCHVVEWKGYGKMLRFTRTADPKFALVADGHAPVEAHMATGGICNSDGNARAVVLVMSKPLDPGARYCMTPRNENDQYRWLVPTDLLVTAPDANR